MPIQPPTACSQCDAGICVKHGQVAATQEPSVQKQTPQKAYTVLYNSKRWRDLRAVVLRKQPLCADPFKENCHQPTTVADHIVDHHGNQQLFYDYTNLQGLCKSCHSRKTGESHGKGGVNIEPGRPSLDANGRIINNE